MTATVANRPLTDRFREILKRAGNPFRNYFARNPDDEVCAARIHDEDLHGMPVVDNGVPSDERRHEVPYAALPFPRPE